DERKAADGHPIWPGAGCEPAAGAARTMRDPWPLVHPLLLLAILAEDVFAPVLDTLALVGLRTTPATDFSRHLAHLLLVGPGNLERGLIRALDRNALGDHEVHVVRETKLQLQVRALNAGAVTNTVDFQNFSKAVGHANHQVAHHGALHPPEGACALAVVTRLHRDAVTVNGHDHLIGNGHGQLAL